MKELHVTIQAKNNLLLERRQVLDLSQGKMAQLIGISLKDYYNLENMHYSPLTIKGCWRSIVLRCAEYFDCSPEELFPKGIVAVDNSRAEQSMDYNELSQASLSDHSRHYLLLSEPESTTVANELSREIKHVTATLTPREELVLQLRFGLNGHEVCTLPEIALMFGVGPERIRQIENKALRKLRHHTRSRLLKEFVQP